MAHGEGTGQQGQGEQAEADGEAEAGEARREARLEEQVVAARIRGGGAAGDRLVVACQRHPWIASVTLSLGVGGAVTALLLNAPGRTTPHDVLALLPLVTASFAAIGHIGRGARATADRLAPRAVPLDHAVVEDFGGR